MRPRLCISNKFPGIGDVAGLEAPAVNRRIRNGVLNIRFPAVAVTAPSVSVPPFVLSLESPRPVGQLSLLPPPGSA